jgi:hypothetical protein
MRESKVIEEDDGEITCCMKCKTCSTLICLAQIIVLYLMIRSGGWADREVNPRKATSAVFARLFVCLLAWPDSDVVSCCGNSVRPAARDA